jgi:hypothetical protein
VPALLVAVEPEEVGYICDQSGELFKSEQSSRLRWVLDLLLS